MEYVCLDLEGVLVPEIWAEVAKFTGEEKFNLTTQNIKNYSESVSYTHLTLPTKRIV